MRVLRDRAFLLACAASALAVTLQISSGMYEPLALALATAVAVVAVVAAVMRGEPSGMFPVQVALGAGILHGLYCHLFLVPTFYANPTRFAGFRGLALMGGVFLSAYLCLHLRASLQKARFWGTIAIFAAMAASILYLSPRPHIDVFYLRAIAANALRAGQNPYSVGYPQIYTGADAPRFYGPFMHDGRVWFYPYPPLVILLDTLASFVGSEPRLISIVGMIVSAWAIARLGREFVGEVAAMLLLFQGRSFFVLEQTWTEPITLAAFAVALLFCVEAPKRVPQWLAIGLAMGVCAASKQYSPLLIVPLLVAAPRGIRLRAGGTALGVVVATFTPFLVWNARDLLKGILLAHLHGVRTESLSLLAAWSRHGAVPSWAPALGFVAGAAILAVSLRKGGVARAATAAAAGWLVLVLLNLQAFCNYDWLGGGLLCAAVAVSSRPMKKETVLA